MYFACAGIALEPIVIWFHQARVIPPQRSRDVRHGEGQRSSSCSPPSYFTHAGRLRRG